MTACCARTRNSSTTMMSPAAIPPSTTTPSSPSLNKVPFTIQVPSDHTTSLLVNSSTTSTAPAVVPVEVHVVKPAAAAATAAASPSDSPQVCRRRRILDQAKQQARCDESTASRSTTASHSRSTTSRQHHPRDVQPRRPPRVIACPETEWRPAVRPKLPVPTIAYKTTKEELQQLEYAKRCLAEHRRAVKLKIRMARQERLQQRFAAGVFTFVEAVTDAATSVNVNVNVNDGNGEEEDDINSLETASRHCQNENDTSSDDSGSDSSDDDDDDNDNDDDSESYTTESSLASSLLKSLAKKHGVPLPSTLSVAAADASTDDNANNNKKAKGDDKDDDEYLAALSSMLVQTARKAITESQHQRLLPLSTTSLDDTRPTDTTSSKDKPKRAMPPVGMTRSMSVPDIFQTLSARELIDSFQNNNNNNTNNNGATNKKNRRASLNHVFFSTPPQESQDYPSTWAPITPTFPTKQQRASTTAKHQQQQQVATNTKPLETSADKDDYRISADVNRAASSRSLVADVQPSLARIFPPQKQQPLKAKSERHLMMSKDDDDKEDDMMMLSSKSKPTSNNVNDRTVNQFLENPLYNPFDFDPSSTTKAVDPRTPQKVASTTTTPTKNKSQPPPPAPQKQRRSSKLWKLLRRRKSIG